MLIPNNKYEYIKVRTQAKCVMWHVYDIATYDMQDVVSSFTSIFGIFTTREVNSELAMAGA